MKTDALLSQGGPRNAA